MDGRSPFPSPKGLENGTKFNLCTRALKLSSLAAAEAVPKGNTEGRKEGRKEASRQSCKIVRKYGFTPRPSNRADVPNLTGKHFRSLEWM